jgi:hypothetical protein
MAVDQNTSSSGKTPFDKSNSSREVSNQVGRTDIVDFNDFVSEVVWEEWLNSLCHLQNVGDIVSF